MLYPIDQLLDNIGHVSEIGRVLQVFMRAKTKTLTEVELIRLSNRTAGQISRYPRPRGALSFGKVLGLVKRSKNGYRLTPLGIQYAEHQDTGASLYQEKLLLGLLLDNHPLHARLSALFKFASGDNIQRISQSSLDSIELQNSARMLQQLNCLRYKDNFFLVNPEFEDIVAKLVITHAGLSEEALWKRLEAQRLRAIRIEELVIESEKSRLGMARRPELADGVVRVSALNSGAGYDVLSFEVNGDPRYIEVKSSVGTALEFEWSENERQTAQEFGRSYWIYFVPLSHLALSEINSMLRIKDPIRKLKQRLLLCQPSAWYVFTSDTVAESIKSKIDGQQTFDW